VLRLRSGLQTTLFAVRNDVSMRLLDRLGSRSGRPPALTCAGAQQSSRLARRRMQTGCVLSLVNENYKYSIYIFRPRPTVNAQSSRPWLVSVAVATHVATQEGCIVMLRYDTFRNKKPLIIGALAWFLLVLQRLEPA
jgi:hypothetical protein